MDPDPDVDLNTTSPGQQKPVGMLSPEAIEKLNAYIETGALPSHPADMDATSPSTSEQTSSPEPTDGDATHSDLQAQLLAAFGDIKKIVVLPKGKVDRTATKPKYNFEAKRQCNKQAKKQKQKLLSKSFNAKRQRKRKAKSK